MPERRDTLPILDLTACLTIPVAQLVAERLGRAVNGRLVEQDVIPRIQLPGLVKLQTVGPVTHRQVVLHDSQPPHLAVAACWAMFVAERLPAAVQDDLAAGGEPLDRLLMVHGVPRQAELLPDEIRKTTTRQPSVVFLWGSARHAAPGGDAAAEHRRRAAGHAHRRGAAATTPRP